MIALIDYGAGNVRSVHKALETVGAEVQLARDPKPVPDADKIVLPGVGAFGDCINSLRRSGLANAILEGSGQGKPVLTICVGMQVLFEEGEEMGHHRGLGLLPGRVVHFSHLHPHQRGAGDSDPLKIPHTGWNRVLPAADSPLLRGLRPGSWTYFNHAYFCQARPEHILATADYGGSFAAVVGWRNIYGIQFHPEKSHDAGLHVLRNFVEHVK